MFATFVPWCRTDFGVVPLQVALFYTERQNRSRFATRQLTFQAPSTGFLGIVKRVPQQNWHVSRLLYP